MNLHPVRTSRRAFLSKTAAGLGGIAMSPLLFKEQQKSARAAACIFLIMEGGPSHIDTFDPKPRLRGLHMRNAADFGGRRYVQSPFTFRRAGEMGIEINSGFRYLSACVDDICFYRGAQADSANHSAAMSSLSTGQPHGGEPSLGVWTAYAHRHVNCEVPSFVALPDKDYPCGGAVNWACGFLPPGCTGKVQIPGVPCRSEMPRMKEVLSLAKEPPGTLDLYGIGQPETDSFGRRCLTARRLVEKGARFVQLFSAGWDAHEAIATAYDRCIRSIDKPVAGLLMDLKQRGMLDSTLVVWAGEFGRSPDSGLDHGSQLWGRDHNASAMTIWFAGGGVNAGHIAGATDEIGAQAVQVVRPLKDVHATLLHLMGIDRSRLTYRCPGRNNTFIHAGGEVIHELIA